MFQSCVLHMHSLLVFKLNGIEWHRSLKSSIGQLSLLSIWLVNFRCFLKCNPSTFQKAKKLSWDWHWISTKVCLGYWVKLTFFPRSSVSFSFYETANQKETEYSGNLVDVKYKKMFLLKQDLLKWLEKAVKEDREDREILRDRNIFIEV